MNKNNIMQPYCKVEKWKGDEHIAISCNGENFLIETPEGPRIIFIGDWTMGPGPDGEFWVVPEDIFQNKYSFY